MKVTMTFDLGTEAGAYDFDRCYHANQLVNALEDFRAWLRRERKYEDLPSKVHEFAEEAWATFHEILRAQGVADLLG